MAAFAGTTGDDITDPKAHNNAHLQAHPHRLLPCEGEVGDVIVGGVAAPPGDTLREQSRFIAKARATSSSKDVPGRKVVDMGLALVDRI
jgi:hypothetical protein